MPESVNDWKKIARQFEERWQFPNCLGAVDGKHCRIIPPSDSGSFFFNYKGFHSIVLMACANANYEFIWCEVGVNGRVSDGGAIKQTKFYKKLISNNLNLPESEKCQTSSIPLPYVFVGDEAFTLRPDFMKPFGRNTLTPERKIYNYRLSRARRIIENIFGIMSNRFRIFHTSINLRLDRIDLIVLTCCVLHNFLRKSDCPYSLSDAFDIEDTTIDDVLPTPAFTALQVNNGNSSKDAKSVRDTYVAYFNGEGNVSWQNDQIN